MQTRKFDELISYFNRKVSSMDIGQKYKMELLGMITAIGLAHEKEMPHWVLCSERLPEEHKSILAKFKGTDLWTKSMWEKQSDEVVVAELFEDGTAKTATACTHDGEWYVGMKLIKREIIAWMPLPEPYKEES